MCARAVFNNAAQVWNHTFFWESMKPGGGGEPTGALADAITKSFGSFAEFKDQYAAAGATQFGSGWAWLVTDSAGNLSIEKTPNAVLPMVTGVLAFWPGPYTLVHLVAWLPEFSSLARWWLRGTWSHC